MNRRPARGTVTARSIVSLFLCALSGGGALVTPAATRSARAEKPQRTWNFLTTGNGHGFQVYDLNRNKLTQFLEHPYRYLRPRPGDPKSDGIGRRNLAFDFYFGIRAAGGGGWLNEGSAGEPSYLDETNIIRVPITLAGVTAETYYFAPFGYEGNAMIALLHAPNATDGFTLLNFHMGDGSPDSPNANGESLRANGDVVVETGPGGGAMVYVPLSAVQHTDCENVFNKVKGGMSLGDKRDCSGNDIVPAFQGALQDGWMAVGVLFVEDASQADTAAANLKAFVGGKPPAQILAAARTEWDQWRKPIPKDLALCTDDEKKLWRQSEAVLRMGQTREPYTATRKNYGMMLASLPPGEWHTGWVRDGLYGTVALARMGHFTEARMGLDFLLNATPVGKYKSYVSDADYRVSVVRYFGTGEEEADYSGQRTPNVETDGWGLTLWAARQYVDASGDTAWLNSTTKLGPTVYAALMNGVAKAMEKNLEPAPSNIAKADSSIWEVHDENKKHFAYTTLTMARGFCDFASLAKKNGQSADAKTYADVAGKVRTGFLSSFLDQQGAIAGSIEELAMNQYLDGAVVEAFTWNIVTDYQGRTAKATLDLLNRLRVESGGFKRNDDGLSSYDNNEWILIDLRMADALWRAGREQEARGVVQLVIDKASANNYLLPELYNAVRADGTIGRYAGNIPMIGYGGGAYVLTMLDRSGLIEPNDCGDDMGNKSSGRAYKCETDGMTPIENGGNMGTPSSEIPYANACLCDVRGRAARPGLVTTSAALVFAALIYRRRRRGATGQLS